MTNEEAIAHAMRLWGKDAWGDWRAPVPDEEMACTYRIGCWPNRGEDDPKFRYGTGYTWEAAFADALRRKENEVGSEAPEL